jgi:hypothetical protein
MLENASVKLSKRELTLSLAIPIISFGGTGLGLLLEWQGIISDAGSFYWGSLAGSFLLGYLAWIKPRKDIVSLLAPLYGVIIFLLAVETKPTVILQVLFAASLTILTVRLNRRFSTPPDKGKEEDPMDKFLYAYMTRITPYFRSVDRDTAHEIAATVLSFKFGIFPNSVNSAEKAIARLKGEGSVDTLRKALIIIRDRAEKLQESSVKVYSEKAFSANDFQYLPISLPPELRARRTSPSIMPWSSVMPWHISLLLMMGRCWTSSRILSSRFSIPIKKRWDWQNRNKRIFCFILIRAYRG